MRKAKLKEIFVWYKFKPNIEIWSNLKIKNNKPYAHKMPDETWYGGYWFNTGYFIFFKGIFIEITWWRIKI